MILRDLRGEGSIESPPETNQMSRQYGIERFNGGAPLKGEGLHWRGGFHWGEEEGGSVMPKGVSLSQAADVMFSTLGKTTFFSSNIFITTSFLFSWETCHYIIPVKRIGLKILFEERVSIIIHTIT